MAIPNTEPLTISEQNPTVSFTISEMEQKHISFGSVLPLKYPWFVAQNQEDQIFYTMHDLHYRCRIPLLLGRRIQDWFHGWVILSNHPRNDMWSLWNPVTRKTIRLPPLTLKDGDFASLTHCCLSSPPDDPASIFMLTRMKTPTIVFCQLDRKRKMLGWKEMSYAKQLHNITCVNGCLLHTLTCCNGKVYALVSDLGIVIQVVIVVKGKEVVITLLQFVELPNIPFYNDCTHTLKGYCTEELFYFKFCFSELAKKTLSAFCMYKLDWASMIWEEIEDLKDTIFFVDLPNDCSMHYRHASSSELGGYIHILGDMGKIIYSYNVKDKTICLSSLCCLVQDTHVTLWDWSLPWGHEEIKCGTSFKAEDDKDDEVIIVRDDVGNTMNEESLKPNLFTIPFDVLKMIMEFCVGVEYLNFRATCKHCQLAAPVIRWSSETSLRRLQQYSLISPWLVVLNRHQNIISFTDPMFGDKYFMKTPQELIGDLQIFSSNYGWLLLCRISEPHGLLFYNPFTNDIREVPETISVLFDSACFSAPPTSTDCIVVGLSASLRAHVFVYFINRESSWRMFRLNIGVSNSLFLFPTLHGKDIYALNQDGALNFVKQIDGRRPSWDGVVTEAPRGRNCSSPQYFLVNCDGRCLLLVVMDEFGKFVEVLKLNDSTQKWEKINSLGKHVIYLCGTTCICMEAKMLEMENKIYFPRLRSGKIIFYCLETCRYHISNHKKDFFGTHYHANPHAWIQPSWAHHHLM